MITYNTNCLYTILFRKMYRNVHVIVFVKYFEVLILEAYGLDHGRELLIINLDTICIGPKMNAAGSYRIGQQRRLIRVCAYIYLTAKAKYLASAAVRVLISWSGPLDRFHESTLELYYSTRIYVIFSDDVLNIYLCAK